MSTVFFNDSVRVDINKGEESTVTIGADIRNVLLVSSHTVFSEAYRQYSNKNELLLDGFSKDSFQYKFAEIYFDSAVDPYDRPKLLISGGVILPNSSDYITKITKVIGKTNNFGIVITDIRYRSEELSQSDEYQFILDIATYIEGTEKFYAFWADLDYIPDSYTWITTNKDEVVLTDTPYGLITERSLGV